jgi:transposase
MRDGHGDDGGHLGRCEPLQGRAPLASWLGLTPKEYSPGNTRHLGHISKRGDRYLRMRRTELRGRGIVLLVRRAEPAEW